MSEEIILAGLGVILPPIIDLVNGKVSNSNWRFVIALVFCLVAGVIMSFLQYGSNVFENVGLIFLASQTVYKLWYEKSNLQNRVRSM